jgi:hypothetical protein
MPELKSDYKKTHEIPLKVQLLEESANELYYKAERLRNEAYNMDNMDKENRFTKLNEAQKFEKEGLIKQKQIIDIYIGKTIIEDDSKGDIAKNENVKINEDLLQAYMDFMDKEDSQTPMESLIELISSDSLSPSNLRNTLNEYLYIEPEVIEITSVEQDSTSEIISQVVAEKYDETKETVSEVYDKNKELKERNIIYKIQIAADKKPLSQNILRKIYIGNKSIKMINENGWHKYSIGDFNTFAEADEYRKKMGVGQAFVVGYEDGAKVDLLAKKTEPVKSSDRQKFISSLTEGLIYKVQIAADKKKMSENMLKNLYRGSEQIDLIEEDGWYKYSVGKLNSYEKAANLKKTVEAKGSFIVAYNNGVKVSLHAAKSGKLISTPVSNADIVFKVQIAADTKSLSSEYLHKIYSGYENIQKYEEDGWHKYSLGEFKTFDEANKFRANSGVKGAFVIAFQGGNKINVLAAKKMRRCYDPVIISDWLSKNKQLIYKVQIVASGKKLSVKQVKNICCIESNVYLIEEGGWFKYSIGNFENYQNAVKMKEKSGVDGAFIIVYKNGEKLSLSKALNMSK